MSAQRGPQRVGQAVYFLGANDGALQASVS